MSRVAVVLLLVAVFLLHSAALPPLPSNNLSLTPFVEFNTSLEWQEFRIRFANVDLPYNMSVPSTNVCNSASVFGFIPSNPVSANVRSAMRDAWINKSPDHMLFRFFVGRPSRPELYEKLLEEQKQFGDLIFFDVQDTYKLLYLKVYAGFQWQQAFCPDVKFVIKIDDDVILDARRLDYWTKAEFEPLQKDRKLIVYGAPHRGNFIPHRNSKSKYYVPLEEYAEKQYPPFLAGALYMMSNEAVSAILEKAPEVNGLSLEDILYIGLIASKAGVYQQDISNHFRLEKFPQSSRCQAGDKTPMQIALCCYHNPKIFDRAYQYLVSLHC